MEYKETDTPMREPSCDEIEYEILSIVTETWRTEPVTTSLGDIYLTLKAKLGDFPQIDAQDALKRLHINRFVVLDKCSVHGQYLPYERWSTDVAFFHHNGFRVGRTEMTKPRADELHKLVASEPILEESSIPARLQRNYFRRWAKTGPGILELDLANGGRTHIGGSPKVRELATWWINRNQYVPHRPVSELSNHTVLIGEERIRDLEALKPAQFDLKKLVQMCREIDIAFTSGCYITVPLLMRAVIDHVPPIFGQPDFGAVVAQARGSSIKGPLGRLDTSVRDAADRIIHEQVKKKAVLPTREQVNGYGIDFNTLLIEIIHTLAKP